MPVRVGINGFGRTGRALLRAARQGRMLAEPEVKALPWRDLGVDVVVECTGRFTARERLVDSLHRDPRRARAAAVNIVPTTTGAARSAGEVLPHLAGRLDGIALRVPVPDGSMTDLTATVRESPSVDEVRDAFRRAASSGPLVGRLEYAEDALVSSDIVGDSASCIFDAELTMAAEHTVKVLGWYDNEWGYSNRLAELTATVGAASNGDR